MEKPRLMLIGPFPPPFGGVANITAQLASSDLSRMFRLRTLNICLPTEKTENTGDRPVNLWKTLRVFLNALHAITHEQPDAVLHQCQRPAAQRSPGGPDSGFAPDSPFPE